MDNQFDGIKSILDKRVDNFITTFKKKNKNTKPFNTEEVPAVDRLYWYDQLSREQMSKLVQKHGEESINSFILEMESIRNRRNK